MLDRGIKIRGRYKTQLIAKFQCAAEHNCVYNPCAIRKFLRNERRGALFINLILERLNIDFPLVVIGSVLELSTTQGLREQHLIADKLICAT